MTDRRFSSLTAKVPAAGSAMPFTDAGDGKDYKIDPSTLAKTSDIASKADQSALTAEITARTNQDTTLNGNDIASGAVVGSNIVLTLKNSAQISINVSSLLADIKLQSGVYNASTKAFDFTLSDSSTVSVPAADLLPVNVQQSIQGNGAGTALSLVGDSASPGNLKLYGTDAAGARGFYAALQLGSATPVINGVAASGSATAAAKEDHVHPTDTTRAATAAIGIAGTDENLGTIVDDFTALTATETVKSAVQKLTGRSMIDLRGHMEDLGPIKAGMLVTGSSSALTLASTSGRVRRPNGGAFVVTNHASQATVTFATYKRDGLVASGITAVPVTNYDAAGTLTLLSTATRAQIMRLYAHRSTANTFALLYGQTEYSNFTNAAAALETDQVIVPAGLADYIEIARIVVRRDALNFASTATTRILSTDKFGEIGGSASDSPLMVGATASVAGASGSVPAPAAGDDSKLLRGDGTWQTVVSDAKDWAANTPVQAKEIRVVNVQGVATYFHSLSARTTGAAFDQAESAFWIRIAQASVGAFVPNELRVAGQQILESGLSYQANSSGTTGATFSADIANWTALSPIGATGNRVDLANFTANGSAGTAAATVDVATILNFPQTTAGITVTLPNPTTATTHKTLVLENTGTADIAVSGAASGSDTLVVPANGGVRQTGWNGTRWAAVSAANVVASKAYASRGGIQSGLSTGTVVTWPTPSLLLGSDITFDAGTSRFTLKAGKTYGIEADCGGIVAGAANGSGVNYIGLELFNVTANARIGRTQFKNFVPSNYASSALYEGESDGPALAYITPTVDTTIDFRVLVIGGVTGISGGTGQFINDSNAQRAYIKIEAVAGLMEISGVAADFMYAQSTGAIATDPFPTTNGSNAATSAFEFGDTANRKSSGGSIVQIDDKTFSVTGGMFDVDVSMGSLALSAAFQYSVVDITAGPTAGVPVGRGGQVIPVNQAASATSEPNARALIDANGTTRTFQVRMTAGTLPTGYDGGAQFSPRIRIDKLGGTPLNMSAYSKTNDQTASGYFDIGAMRINWGRASNVSSITFPGPFKSGTIPSVTVTPETSGPVSGVQSAPPTSINFSAGVVNTQTNSWTTNGWAWMAIGQKP
jgi:hypothetical protein